MTRVKRCSRCSAEFPCGPDPAKGRCWCEDLPPVMPMSAEDCLCPRCLEADVAGKVGLCLRCRHSQVLKTKGGSAVFLCRLSERNPAFPKYPRLPMARCPGHAS